MNLHSEVALTSRNFFLGTGVISEDLVTATGHEPATTLVRKRALTHSAELAILSKWLSVGLRTKWLWIRVPLQSLANWWELM